MAMWSHSVTASSVIVAVRSARPRFWDWSLITWSGGYKMGKSRVQNFLRFKTLQDLLFLPQGQTLANSQIFAYLYLKFVNLIWKK